MRLLLAVIASLVFGLLSTSCFEPRFKYEQVQTRLRYFPEDDTLFVLETEHGIGEIRNPYAEEQFRKIVLEKKRIYPAYGGIVDLDFDAMMVNASERTVSELTEQERAMLPLVQGISVVKLWFTWSNTRGLSLCRLWRLPKASHAPALMNDIFNSMIREGSARQETFQSQFPILDEESLRMFAAHAERNTPWIRMNAASIEVEFPMTQQSAARCLAELMNAAHSPDDQGTLAIFDSVKALEVTKDHALLRFTPESDGWYQFESKAAKAHHEKPSGGPPPGFSFVPAPTPDEIEELVKKR